MVQDLIKISVASGFIFLDSAPVGQWMISQPIVCAPLIGWLWGYPLAGLLMGTLLQLLWTGRLPIGTSCPPEASICALVSTIIYIFAKQFSELGQGIDWMTLVYAITCGIGAGVIGGKMTIAGRELNNHFSLLADGYAREGSWFKITSIPWIANLLIWICASLIIFVVCGLALLLLAYIQSYHFHIDYFKYCSWLLIPLGVSVILDVFKVRMRIKFLVTGVILGFGIGYLAQIANK